ncbi:tricarballylate/proton symporter TcuC [Phaeospirillum tilakii]|uniref:Tricarballylate/proton symporter TcuC n=1 Tax=Phaeospirillum tilakii TaxID=741673 RepID=A0ABW5C976_9PROT
MTAATGLRAKIWRVVQVASGNFLEMYDFMVFGYYAGAIGRAFFPADSEFASLMLTLMTFGAGFLMRPLGAIVLGAYIDHHGRRAGLLLTLALMALGMVLISALPGYATLGLFAPLLVVLGRLLQGFSAGVELGGVSVYLSEIAPPGQRGLYVAWQSASLNLAVVAAAAIGVALHSALPLAEVEAWGWRIPMLIGCLIIPALLLLRRGLTETEAFAARRHHPTVRDILRGVATHWRIILLGMLMVTISNAAFYLLTAYTPTFGSAVLHLSSRDALLVTLCVGITNVVCVPLGGALSDRVGRRPVMLAAAGLILLAAYPLLSWLAAAPSLTRMLEVEETLAVLYALYNGAMIVHVTEIMPFEVRTAGFSLAYSLSQTLFGGFTPAICTYLIHVSGNPAIPGAWLSFAALLAIGALLAFPRFKLQP